MARRLEHGRGCHDGGIDLQHVVFHDEVFAPFRDDVRLERRTRGAVIVQTRDAYGSDKRTVNGPDSKRVSVCTRTPVDFKSWRIEEPAIE